MRPATNPNPARTTPAGAARPTAPLVGVDPEADDDGLPVDELPAEAEVEVVLEAVAFAAVWNAEKDLAAVGLTAKTIPFAQ